MKKTESNPTKTFIWKISVSEFMEKISQNQFEFILSSDEYKSSSRYKKVSQRHSRLVSYYTLRYLLSKYVGGSVEPSEWVFEKNAHGKPKISNPYVDEEIHFSLSRTENIIVIAISGKNIGVDIQSLAFDWQWENIAKMYYHTREQEFLSETNPDTSLLHFVRIWTLKEAYFKYLGTGLSDRMKDVYFESLCSSYLLFQVNDNGRDTGYVNHRSIEPTIFLSVATEHQFNLVVKNLNTTIL